MKNLNIMKWGMGLVCLMLVSCNSWLDVKPETKIEENDLFKDEEGFNVAMNGIYLGMAKGELYGKELSCGFIEALAQLYKLEKEMTGNSNRYVPFAQYDYKDKNAKAIWDATWKSMYELIANCNNLLTQAPNYRQVFSSEEAYHSYMGRLYMLRAFLHFDVFRLWGPVYTAASKNRQSIPYYKIRTSLPVALSTAEEVITNVLADLQVADSLLVGGPGSRKMDVSSDAVRALRARVYLYIGEKEKAYAEAIGLIGPEGDAEDIYPFVSRNEALNSTAPDRLYYSEQIFMIENSKRNALYEDLFDYLLDDAIFLAPTNDRILELYPNENDYRYHLWKINPGNGKQVSFVKFAKVTQPSNALTTVGQSLLKVSELYLILAECAPTAEERVEWMDRLRVGRGYQAGDISEAEKNDWSGTLQTEYQREFYGEGQFFYYLKRNNIPSIIGYKNESIVLGAAQYEPPLPESESKYR